MVSSVMVRPEMMSIVDSSKSSDWDGVSMCVCVRGVSEWVSPLWTGCHVYILITHHKYEHSVHGSIGQKVGEFWKKYSSDLKILVICTQSYLFDS